MIHISGLLQLLELVGVDLELAELGVLHVNELTHGQLLLLVLVKLRHVLHEELLLLQLLLGQLQWKRVDVLLLVDMFNLLFFLTGT